MTVAFPTRGAGWAALVLALASFGSPAPVAGPAAAADAALGPVTNLPLPRFVSMRAESANARRGPSLDQRVDWEFVRQGLPLEITAEYGQWRRVRDAEGAGGWVHHALLSGARTALVLGEEPVPLRAGPTEAAAVLALAEPGVIGSIEACRSEWCEIAAGGVEGWLPRAVLWGVGPDETIE
jgi:SH3-like domain-containing protein